MPILVIEDDERIVNFVRRGLENEGHGVEWAMTQSEAYEALVLHDHAFDVIIIDWHLGLEAWNGDLPGVSSAQYRNSYVDGVSEGRATGSGETKSSCWRQCLSGKTLCI